jgi:quinoprotein glucose dehydrogenase
MLLVGLALTLGACAQGPRPSAVAKGPGASFDYVSWDAYLGGSESSQYSALDQINRSNVTELDVAWTFPTGTGGPPNLNPLIVNGNLYIWTNGNNLTALDPATGKERWRRQIDGRPASRGMSYWQSEDGADRRLLFLADGMLRAVSADNGEPIASFGTDGKVDLRPGLDGDISKIRPLQTNNPGRVFENLIIVSLPAGAYDFASAPADIHAYDVRTGKLAWVFHVVPRIGEFGSETWPEKDREKFGGVHNWSESTVDKELGIIYIPTGTARYDFYGGNRPGDNLFANSILALDARTGKRIWHFQTIHHDLWDFDLPAAPKLLTIHRDGKDIPILAQPSKHGFLFVLDRRTGKPIWPIEERPVPKSDVPGEKASPTQPFPTWPKPFARNSFTEADINPYIPKEDQEKVRAILRTARNEGLFTPPSLQGSISLPGHNGGANWGNAAVDPIHQKLFVVSRTVPTLDKLTLDARPQAAAAMPNGGGEVQPYKSPVDFMIQSNGLSAIGPPWSTLTAYDMNSGDILWQIPNGDVTPLVAKGITGTGSHVSRAGPVVTGGGLIFVATSADRKLRARDETTGAVLWEHDLPAASEGVPAVYEAGGRQFVVIPVGGVGLFSDKLGLPEPGPNQYMAFALPSAASADKAGQ